MPYILALDQGTTSSRAIIYNEHAESIGSAQKEFKQIFPKPGWVEHNANEIWESQFGVLQEVLDKCNLTLKDISGIGITNQRETTVIWNKNTGEPIYNAIVWQDRRTSEFCKSLVTEGHAEQIKQKTGLVVDAYFSGTKVKWILDNVDGAREMSNKGQLLFGTVDSWLIWKLSDGKSHITDVSNASRTMLYNIHDLKWDTELLDLLDVPESILPEVVSSSGELAQTSDDLSNIPITGVAGDQQAALFGQMCLGEGMAKNTYGTGCFLMINTGHKAALSKHNLLTTLAWKIGDDVTYALEGSVFVGGAVIQWLRDQLNFFDHASESESVAENVEDTGGVYFVPALTGLGAPHWDQDARGMIIGITRGTTKAHITRAAIEAMCFQVDDVLQAMGEDMGSPIQALRVDGGAVANNLLVQFQADISETEVIRPTNLETTALGAAYLAGIGIGLWNIDELKEKWIVDRQFLPEMNKEEVSNKKIKWAEAVRRAKNWS